jgi:hypothetical protein
VDGRDELRAALKSRQDADDATAQRQQELDAARQAFERDEEAIKKRLYDAASAMLEALVKSGTAMDIPIGEKPYGLLRLFRSQMHVQGWEVELPGAEGKVLCTDGRFVFAPHYPQGLLRSTRR